FAVDAFVFSAFPKDFTALAVVEGIFVLGCVATVYLLLRHWGAPRLVASLSGGAAAIACNLEAFNELGNLTEVYLLWPATLSMYCFTRSGARFERRCVVMAGFLSGVASLFKPVGLAPLLAQLAFLALLSASRQIRFSHAFRSIAINATGVFFAWVPFGVYFWKHHA